MGNFYLYDGKKCGEKSTMERLSSLSILMWPWLIMQSLTDVANYKITQTHTHAHTHLHTVLILY